MKTKKRRIETRFGAETRFEVAPVAAVPFRGTAETELERLKIRLLRTALQGTTDANLYAPLRRAANEAAALAWLTPFPLLFLPELFEEKLASVRRLFGRAPSARGRSLRACVTLA